MKNSFFHIFLILLFMTVFCSACAGNTNKASEPSESQELPSVSGTERREEVTEGGAVELLDFRVDPQFQDGLHILETDREESRKLAAHFAMAAEKDPDQYDLSQPYPVINRPGRVFNAYLFRDGRCVGILSFSEIGGNYSGSFVDVKKKYRTWQ